MCRVAGSRVAMDGGAGAAGRFLNLSERVQSIREYTPLPPLSRIWSRSFVLGTKELDTRGYTA
jgi:hypothetical protein